MPDAIKPKPPVIDTESAEFLAAEATWNNYYNERSDGNWRRPFREVIAEAQQEWLEVFAVYRAACRSRGLK